MNKEKSDLEKQLNEAQQCIAEQQRQITLLSQAEEKYRHFFEQSPAMIYVVDNNGKIVNTNRAGVEILGGESLAAILGSRFEDYFLADQSQSTAFHDLLNSQGSIQEFDTRLKRLDGKVKYVQLSAAMRKTISGKVRGFEGFVVDITARKETEKRLAESETKYKTVLDNSLAAIYLFQDGGYFSYVNPRMVKVLGYDSEDEIIGRGFWEIIAPEDREKVKKRGLEREKREFSPRRYKFRMLKKNGEQIWVDMRASHASYLGSPAAVGNFIDITKEIQSEEKIGQLTQRIISGIEDERRSLANDIHDEFGQRLTSLLFDIEVLQSNLPKKFPELFQLCGKISSQIQRLAEKVRDTTSRLRPDLLDHLGLVPTIKWYINNILTERPDLEISFQSAGLKKRLEAEIELVLYRVFQEGINNIIKHAKAHVIEIQLTFNFPDIIFIVRDDGIGFIVGEDGMPLSQAQKAIGLLSMKERVSSLNGKMKILSAPGKGTHLRIKIPIQPSSNYEQD